MSAIDVASVQSDPAVGVGTQELPTLTSSMCQRVENLLDC